MCVELKKLGIVYMPIPKAACTSVKAALSSIDDDFPVSNDEVQQHSKIVHNFYKTSRFRPHRWEQYENEDWWSFSVVRDPLKRLLSVYTNRIVSKQELRNSPRLRKQSHLPSNPDPDFFFQNLKGYIDHSSVIKHHALPSKLFIGPNPERFDRIYTTGNLSTLADDLSERAGKEVKISQFNSSETPLRIEDLSPKTVSAIRVRLADEYDHLNAYFSNPFE